MTHNKIQRKKHRGGEECDATARGLEPLLAVHQKNRGKKTVRGEGLYLCTTECSSKGRLEPRDLKRVSEEKGPENEKSPRPHASLSRLERQPIDIVYNNSYSGRGGFSDITRYGGKRKTGIDTHK